jgi:hypothetical protein
MSDSASNEKSALAKQYLESTVVPVLTQALTQMCVQEPSDPFTWLAQVSKPYATRATLDRSSMCTHSISLSVQHYPGELSAISALRASGGVELVDACKHTAHQPPSPSALSCPPS